MRPTSAGKEKQACIKTKHGHGCKRQRRVIGAIARKGNVVAQMIEKTDSCDPHEFVHKTVEEAVSLMLLMNGADMRA